MGRNFGVVGPAYNIHHEMNIHTYIHTYMIKGNIPRRAGTHKEKKTVYIGLPVFPNTL